MRPFPIRVEAMNPSDPSAIDMLDALSNALERFSAELNHRGFTWRPFFDSRSVLAKEAGANGSSFIT